MTGRKFQPAVTQRRVYTGSAGIYAHTCYALAMLRLDAVRRSTVRALLPEFGISRYQTFSQAEHRRSRGTSGSRYNITTDKFQKTLVGLERDGLIVRGEVFVKVLNPAALLDRAMRDIEEHNTRLLLSVEKAIVQINREIRDAERDQEAPVIVERRRLELKRLQALMTQNVVGGIKRSGTGSVNRIAPGQTI